MELIEKRLYYIELFSLYKGLLSNAQKEILSDYLNCDLSVSEIASNRNVSRAAIEDAIQKGMKKLDEIENEIKMNNKNETIIKNVHILRDKFGECIELDNIEEVIKNGI